MNYISKFRFCSEKIMNFTKLENRGILQIQGKDSLNILQGLTTNDLKLFEKDQELIAQSTLFLNNQARIISDAIIMRPKIIENKQKIFSQDEYWLDLPKDKIKDIQMHIKKYALRKQIEIDDLSEQIKVFSMWSFLGGFNPESQGKQIKDMFIVRDEQSETEESDYVEYCDLNFVDPRSGQLGVRIVTGQAGILNQKEQMTLNNELLDKNLNILKQFQILNGICEVNSQFIKGTYIYNTIPFAANFDLFNSISFNKGCYQGQELISRSYHTGVVFINLDCKKKNDANYNLKRKIRYEINMQSYIKKVINLDESLIQQDFTDDLTGKQITNFNGEVVGKVICKYIFISQYKQYWNGTNFLFKKWYYQQFKTMKNSINFKLKIITVLPSEIYSLLNIQMTIKIKFKKKWNQEKKLMKYDLFILYNY